MNRLFVAPLATILLATAAQAEIVIGQTTVLTGGAAANVADENVLGHVYGGPAVGRETPSLAIRRADL